MSVSGNAFLCKLNAVYKNVKNVSGTADEMIIHVYDEYGNDHEIDFTEFLNVTIANGLKLGFDNVHVTF